MSKEGTKLIESLKIEQSVDPVSKLRPKSSVTFNSTSKLSHPYTKFASQQPLNLQCANYPMFWSKHLEPKSQTLERAKSANLNSNKKPIILVNMKSKASGHKCIIDTPVNQCENGDFNPNFNSVKQNLSKSYV